ncbi:DUF5753 domain-containing protein [Streptomyces sp. NPDC048269]|uniref:DUF5753 domain-containing protein n=1 Tax=Streptomyces sp. NPDC048269 TaxID=3155753 RepID=UPI0034404887
MPNQRAKPTLRRRRLGALLQDCRDKAGLTGAAAAALMGWDDTKLSKIENARAHIAPKEVNELLGHYGVTDQALIAGCAALSKDAGKQGWWATYGDVAAKEYQDLLSLETDAEGVRFYSPSLVPGLLQTPAYARAIISATAVTRTAEEIEALAAIRLARQSVLTRIGNPLRLRVVISEAVLHQRFVDTKGVMLGQMERLLDASENPNYDIQIMPLNATPHAGLVGMFYIVGFQHPWPTVVSVESIRGSSFIEGTDEVAVFETAFERVTATALPVDQSREVIKKMIAKEKNQ